MENSGLLTWANNICLTMASDPGRQVFKDQVQTHGFMFLEDYLDNIISGAKADPLIELVKTPGRKKAIAKKPKLLSSKLANNIFIEPEALATENEAPPSTLKAALENVRHTKPPSTGYKATPNSSEPSSDKNARSPFATIQPLSNNPSISSVVEMSSVPSTRLQAPEQPNADYNDLSVIAEDDEPSERSRINIPRLTETIVSLSEPKSEPGRTISLSALESKEDLNDMDITTTSSVDSMHSIPLNSPPQESQKVEHALPIREDDFVPPAGSPKDVQSELLPTSSATEIQDYLMTETQEGDAMIPIEPKAVEKPVVLAFPTLPEPMPLPKSTRPTRGPSLNAVMLGSATPGAPVGGKRTSWLMKVRETNPVKKTSTSSFNINAGSSQATAQGTKRKSEDTIPRIPLSVEEDERQVKVAKAYEGESASRKSKEPPSDKPVEEFIKNTIPVQEPVDNDEGMQQGVLDRLKKTVEGLGARGTKNMSKSMGGGAATALAEARAAAEARVAERDRKEEEMTMAMGRPSAPQVDTTFAQKGDVVDIPVSSNRLSISELFPTDSRIKEKHKAPEKPFQFTPSFVPTSTKKAKEALRERTSTTPIHSPSAEKSRPLPPAPVFNKPPPVFVPPVQATGSTSQPSYPSVFSAPSAPKFHIPPSMALKSSPPVSTMPTAPKVYSAVPLSAQSTMESIQTNIFDRDDDAWMPSTQETDYTTYQSQSQPHATQICDEDDSWPVDEKLAAGVQWTYGVSKEDSMTWSTIHSQSQRADTGPFTRSTARGPASADVDMETQQHVDEDLEHRDTELEDAILGSSKSNEPVLEQPKIPRSQSQMSMASSESSQSQTGILGQASKLLSSALGTSKKKQPEVKKILQLAASAAKKQQEEADKKATRLKEMEHRRQLALQRKADEEKAKALEEERKVKEETERRKKEREDQTEKRTIKPSMSKKEEEIIKKAKIEPEKKEIKKPLIGKSHLKGLLKQPSTSNLNSVTQPVHTPVAESSSSQKGKSIARQPPIDEEVSQPSQLVQSQMAARAKAQIDASKQTEPRVASENIELPDINSEYSDSEDEDRPRTFDPPEWAQSPELRQALEMQSTINPDDIFGAVRPLRMEEIFKTKTSRFRPRSSSANWTGTDRLTVQEEKDYARRMGFK